MRVEKRVGGAGLMARASDIREQRWVVMNDLFSVVDVFPGGLFNVTLLRILARRAFIYGGTVVRRK